MPGAEPDAKRLLALLAEERAAILAGAFGGLPGLAARKTRLAAAVSRRPPGADMLEALRSAAARNAALIDAALAGVRAVQARRRGANGAGLATYAADGSRAELGPGAGRVLRRA